MGLIAQKFGGSSVADADCVRNVTRIITKTCRRGHQVVTVLSAQGDATDDLVAKTAEISPSASKREVGMLLSTGEQISCSLCAMATEAVGYPVASLTGWQAGFRTNSSYGDARIEHIDTGRVLAKLDGNTIVIVTDFQGLNRYEDITTLGRGGSDTSAVALAAMLHANPCQIYTDVDGVYTADPRHVKGTRKLEEVAHDKMLELTTLDTQAFHSRSMEVTKRYGVSLEVLSSFSGKPGTKVKEVARTMGKLHVSGVACDKNVARMAVVGLVDEPGIAFKTFSLLVKERISVDLILWSIGRSNTKDISFTVSIQNMERCKQLLDGHRDFPQFDHIDVNGKVAKVSIVEASVVHNPGVAAEMLKALYNVSIDINMISTNKVKVSVLVDINEADRVVQVVHSRFFHEFDGN